MALLIGLAFFAVMPAAAQDGGVNGTPGETTIHVVQRGETLFGIAMQYGTTVEAIAETNGITDPRYIAVGQRLLVPNAQAHTPGAIVWHTVSPGDTLPTLTHAYNTTVESLAAANYITNPARLVIGQELTISQGAAGSAQAVPGGLHHVQPGENLYRIALNYRVSVNALLVVNGFSSPVPVFPGQRIWLPGSDGTALTELPPPFVACTVSPNPAIQGKTISLHVTTAGPAVLSGTFMNSPIHVAAEGSQHYALIGVHVFTASGVYPLALTAAAPDGTQTTLTLRLKLVDGGYGTEDILLAAEQEDLLNPTVTEPEWERIATIMSGFSEQRHFDGLMGLPSTGAITSGFGTQRAYNEGELNTFHSGTDFGGAPNSPVLAPAAGIVVMADTLPVRGNATIIDHGWGVYTGYWHQTAIYVSEGDIVMPGQEIGTVGSTGRSTGPHLHWEMWVGGVQVDPMQWVQQSFP